jgi:hypothetical protein
VIFFEQIPWADADPTFRPVDAAEMHSFRAGAAGAPGTLGPAATDLLAHPMCPRGPKGPKGKEALPCQPLIGDSLFASAVTHIGDRPAACAL